MVRQKARRRDDPSPSGRSAAGKNTSTLFLWYEENKRWAPLVGTVFGAAILYLLMQVQTLRNPVAFLGGLAWIVGYLVWGLGRPQDAPARPGRSSVWWPLVALVVVSSVGLGFIYVTTIYRGAPAFRTTLAREGSTERFRLSHPKQRLVLVVHGSFQRDVGASAEGEYTVVISNGRRETALDGKLERSTSRTRIRRGVKGASSTEYSYGTHEIATLGKGQYTLEHAGVTESLRPHLRIAVYTTWASRAIVAGGGAALFLLALLLDVIGARAGHRTRAAGGVASVVSFTETFRTMATPDAIVSAVIVGIIASFLVGGALGWVGEQIAKRAGGETTGRRRKEDREDEDENEEPSS